MMMMMVGLCLFMRDTSTPIVAGRQARRRSLDRKFRNPMVSRTTYVVLVTQDENPHRASPPQEPACGCATSRNFSTEPRSRGTQGTHQLLMWKGNKSNYYYKQLRDGANEEIFCDSLRATKFSRLSEPSVHEKQIGGTMG